MVTNELTNMICVFFVIFTLDNFEISSFGPVVVLVVVVVNSDAYTI